MNLASLSHTHAFNEVRERSRLMDLLQLETDHRQTWHRLHVCWLWPNRATIGCNNTTDDRSAYNAWNYIKHKKATFHTGFESLWSLGWSLFCKFSSRTSLLAPMGLVWLLEELHYVKLFSNHLIFNRCIKTLKFCWGLHKLNIGR